MYQTIKVVTTQLILPNNKCNITISFDEWVYIEVKDQAQLQLGRHCNLIITKDQGVFLGKLSKIEIINSSSQPLFVDVVKGMLTNNLLKEKQIKHIFTKSDRHKTPMMMNSLYVSESPNYEQIIQVDRYLSRLLRLCGTSASIGKSQRLDPRLIMVNRYIRNNFEKSICLEELSNIAQCNSTYLCNVYSKVFKVSPIYHINKLRIVKAGELLINNNITVSKVAETVGFNSSSHLCTIFKRYLGVTPSEYKRAALKKSLL
ncbi:helix-turn-helix domain-containing protein [Paenibacillus glucanolyticus]|uniref:helix-turn-helix domain-containing protein n=1 Tax=Paenibacillus glucanolyticus TaxID=59843 RepID=UPI0034CD12B5